VRQDLLIHDAQVARAWNDDGIEQLRPRFGGAKPLRLTPTQFAELCESLEKGQPLTPQQIHTLIKGRYGGTYYLDHLSRSCVLLG
jgi:transposase